MGDFTLNTQIINDGAVLRIEKNGKILLVAKDQVKTIDTVRDNIVRIDIGEGPLKNIFLNYQEVADPAVASANELRDTIKAMMLSDQYDGGDAKETTQISILNQLGSIAEILSSIQARETDITQLEPSRTDESNPYMIYRGWHGAQGNTNQPEWAIERIRRENDEIIHEWAFGTKEQIYVWDARVDHNYVPYNYAPRVGARIVEGPVDVPAEGNPQVLPDSNPPVLDQNR